MYTHHDVRIRNLEGRNYDPHYLAFCRYLAIMTEIL